MRVRLPLLLLLSHCLLAQAEQIPNTLPPAPKPIAQEERSVDVRLIFERLRMQPRPGDLQNAGVLANVGDVFEIDEKQRAGILAARQAYDEALVKKATQWEAEIKALRAEYDAKVLENIPAERRDAAAKALAYSHEEWTTPMDIEARIRGEFVDRKATVLKTKADAEEADAARKEFQKWVKTEGDKVRTKNAEIVKTLKSMLTAEEAKRLDTFDKNRAVPTPAKPGGAK